VERVFGVLENYWNGDPLTSIPMALGMAEGMTYKGIQPTVGLVEGDYAKGIRLTKKQMAPYERCLERLAGLAKWCITITACAAAVALNAINCSA
jgi:hypothetical protein